MTAQTMSFRYELACKGHSTEKAQDLVIWPHWFGLCPARNWRTL